MLVGFAGMTHLGSTMADAAELRGIQVRRIALRWSSEAATVADCDLVIVGRDVDKDEDLPQLQDLLEVVLGKVCPSTPVVLMSQVPPGFTRPWLARHKWLFYQVDTLIMNCALFRALYPERHIVGCEDPTAALPARYQLYLAAFPAPVLRMSIESAEVAKIAINFMLAAQVSAANTLATVAERMGGNWSEIAPALRLDKRIGAEAYIEPGVIGGHLPRDVKRIRELAGGGSMFAEAIGPLA